MMRILAVAMRKNLIHIKIAKTFIGSHNIAQSSTELSWLGAWRNSASGQRCSARQEPMAKNDHKFY
jgi:hypothetical protein